jgi:hypothetical protein
MVTGRVYIKTKEMVIYTMANLKTTNYADQDQSHTRMEIDMLANGLITLKVVKALFTGRMGIDMKDYGKIVKVMGRAYLHMQMVTNFMDTGLMESWKVKLSFIKSLEKLLSLFGRIIKKLSRTIYDFLFLGFNC